MEVDTEYAREDARACSADQARRDVPRRAGRTSSLGIAVSRQALPAVTLLIVVVALAAVALACAPFAGAAIPQGNLVQNPGAEQPAAPASDTGVAPPTGWSPSPGFTVMAYGRTGFPSTSVGDGIGGGTNFFAGGPGVAIQRGGTSSSTSRGPRRRSTPATCARASAPTSAGSPARATRRASPSRSAPIALGDGGQLGAPLTIGPVTPGDRNNVTTLLRRDASVTVPAGARSVLISITATRTDGAYNDGYADNVSLVLTDNDAAPSASAAPRASSSAPLRGRPAARHRRPRRSPRSSPVTPPW